MKHIYRRFILSAVLVFPVVISTGAQELAGHCLATNSYSQSKLFTMKTSQKTVKQVFQEIEKNSEYIIFYMDQIIDTNRKVNIDVKNQQVSVIRPPKGNISFEICR